MNPYCGESDGKRVMRWYMYNRALKYWRGGLRPGGWAVVLAGPEACEVGALRDLLRWPAERTLFVDRDPRGLARAVELWPGVKTYQGELVDALAIVRDAKIGFAHFDFMGHTDATVRAVCETAGRLIKPSSFTAFTFLRGRELGSNPYWCDLRTRLGALDQEQLRDAARPNWDPLRLLGINSQLRAWLLRTDDELKTQLRCDVVWPRFDSRHFDSDRFGSSFAGFYNSGRSPMLVTGFYAGRRVTPRGQDCSLDHGGQVVLGLNSAKTKLRGLIENTRKLPASTLSNILHIPAGRIAALRAHATMRKRAA